MTPEEVRIIVDRLTDLAMEAFGHGHDRIKETADLAASALTILAREREELREALKPFAKAGWLVGPNEPDGVGVICYAGDLRRARSALKDI